MYASIGENKQLKPGNLNFMLSDFYRYCLSVRACVCVCLSVGVGEGECLCYLRVSECVCVWLYYVLVECSGEDSDN